MQKFVTNRDVRGLTGESVEAFRTTLLNNHSDELTRSIQTMEFRELNRIVFVERDGSETVLWSRTE